MRLIIASTNQRLRALKLECDIMMVTLEMEIVNVDEVNEKVTTEEQQKLTQLDDALETIGEYLASHGCYLKLYYFPPFAEFSIELYKADEPSHMRDTELNRVISIEKGGLWLRDGIMKLCEELDQDDKIRRTHEVNPNVTHFDFGDAPDDGRNYWACPECELLVVEEVFHKEEGKCWDCHRKSFNGFMDGIISNFEE